MSTQQNDSNIGSDIHQHVTNRVFEKTILPAFGTVGLSLVHDLSGSLNSVLLDIERLRLDVHTVEQSLQAAQQQILGLDNGRLHVTHELSQAIESFQSICDQQGITISLHSPTPIIIDGKSVKF